MMKSRILFSCLMVFLVADSLSGSIRKETSELDRTGDGKPDIRLEMSYRGDRPVSLMIDWYGNVGYIFYLNDGNLLLLYDTSNNGFLDIMLYFDEHFELIEGFRRRSEISIDPLNDEELRAEGDRWKEMIIGFQAAARSMLDGL